MNTMVFSSIATQLITTDKVELNGKRLPVRRIGHQRLKSVSFSIQGRDYMAIEQNTEKPSPWGQLAKNGHAVVQFKDVKRNKVHCGGRRRTGERRSVSTPASSSVRKHRSSSLSLSTTLTVTIGLADFTVTVKLA